MIILLAQENPEAIQIFSEPLDLVSFYAVGFEGAKFILIHGVLLLITGAFQRL